MNRFILKILILLGVFISPNLIAQDCNASFQYQIVNEISSYTYRFFNKSNSSSPIISYNWSFGDGSTSKLFEPEHQYLDEGSFTVSLSILTTDSCTSTYIDTIYVEKVIPPNCMAYFTFIYLSQSPLYTYTFSDHSVSGNNDTINAWFWTFGDGMVSAYQNPTHQYQTTGSFLVTLTIATKLGCQSVYSFNVVVNPSGVSCQAAFTANQDTISNPLKYIFHDNSIHSTNITSWKWYFDDGDSSSLQDPTHTYPFAGIYFVKLIINTQGGCSSEITYPINVNNPNPYNLWGRVYAGPYVIDKCIAYLYKEFNNHYYKPIDTVRLTSINDTLGVYYFFQVPEGRHKVKVLLPNNSQYSEDYAPTYYGDNVKWPSGTSINLYQDIAAANVNLESTNKILGNCQISGSVYSTNNQIPKTENIELLIYNSQGNLIDYTFTNQFGEFSFNDLTPGQYFVTGEITGLYADMINVKLFGNNDTVSNITLNIDNKKITGYLILDNPNKIQFSIYPNPTTNLLNIKFDTPIIDNQISIEIFDTQGRVVKKVENLFQADLTISIEVNNLYKGLYFLRITSKSNNNSYNYRFIKQ